MENARDRAQAIMARAVVVKASPTLSSLSLTQTPCCTSWHAARCWFVGGWNEWSCYWAGVYLLDTILTGLQFTSLLDILGPHMSGNICISKCVAANSDYKYAITLAGICSVTLNTPLTI